MPFTALDYEQFEDDILRMDRNFKRRIYEKLEQYDTLGCMQTWLILSKFGRLALEHKKLVLDAYKDIINGQIDLIKAYLSIVEAGAGNISPAGNIAGLLNLILNFINVGTLQAQLGTFQGTLERLANKPLLAYVSEIIQRTEDIYNNNLTSAYDVLQSGYILPHKALR